MFEFIGVRTMAFGGWSDNGARVPDGGGDLSWRGVVDPGPAGYLTGFPVVRWTMTKADLYRWMNRADGLAHDYSQLLHFVSASFEKRVG